MTFIPENAFREKKRFLFFPIVNLLILLVALFAFRVLSNMSFQEKPQEISQSNDVQEDKFSHLTILENDDYQ